jgi:diaminopimelate epimerase
MKFFKYQGTGNDFILINNMKGKLELSTSDVQWLCDRKFGIGSDGLILLEQHPEMDFDMLFYNPDGSKSFCGNGSRCAVAFARDQGILGGKTSCSFMAIDGAHRAWIKPNSIRIEMRKLQQLKQLKDGALFIHTGSPHYVAQKADLDMADFQAIASAIRYDEAFEPAGTNVNFIWPTSENSLKMRTYERGVEAETLSCGTGVTAAAIALHQFRQLAQGNHLIMVETRGGTLQVGFNYSDQSFENIFLEGPAEMVYSGEVEIG